jgi:nucleotide-binding universal stress UspA family protein
MSNDVDTEAAVVVGVGAHGPLAETTVDLVVTMATGLGLGVEVLHVVPTLPATPFDAGASAELRSRMLDEGRRALRRETTRMRDRMAGVQPVEGALVEAAVVGALVEQSRRAELVVLERHEQRRWWDRLGGSVLGSVAARSHAPVVCVPAEWRPSPEPLPVVVAVEDAAHARAQIWTAASAATALDRPLEVLRADPLAMPYRDVLRREGREQEFLDRIREALVRDAALPLSVREHVPCSFTVRWGRPPEVLVEASAAASMMVLARRDPLLPVGTHLGPVVRAVLDAATCPVLVVDPVRAPLAVRHAA